MTITLAVILWWILIGLVVGAVARLVIPGRQHIGIIVTILIGIVAAIVGGILTAAILGAGHTIITFIVAVLLAALVVSLFTTRGYGYSRGRTRSRSRARYRRPAGRCRARAPRGRVRGTGCRGRQHRLGDPPDGHDHRGDPAAAGQQHVQRGGYRAALRPAAGGRDRQLGHRRYRPVRTAPAPVRDRPERRAAGRAGQESTRYRPAARVGARPGSRHRASRRAAGCRAAGCCPAGPGRGRDPRRRPGRDAADRTARGGRAAERPGVGLRRRLRRANPGPAAGRGPVHHRRRGPGHRARPAPGRRYPGGPHVPAPLGGGRGAAEQPAPGPAAGRTRARAVRGLYPGRGEPGDQRRLLRRLPGP